MKLKSIHIILIYLAAMFAGFIFATYLNFNKPNYIGMQAKERSTKKIIIYTPIFKHGRFIK